MEQELIQGKELLHYQPKASLTLISRGRVTSIPIASITHITKLGGITRIYTRKNNYQTYDSLLSLMKDLPINDFFQVGRSHIVSLMSIVKIVNCAIILENHVVLLSPHYRVQLELQLKRILERIVIFYEKIKPSIETVYDELHGQMLCDLSRCNAPEECFWVVKGYWDKVKERYKESGIRSESDEVDFFKNIKPFFTSYLEYYVILSEALISAPSESGLAMIYWEAESKRFQRFVDKNNSFVGYYICGETDMDDRFFRRVYPDDITNGSLPLYDMDPAFCSTMDHLVRGYLAHKMYNDYVMKKLEELA